MYCTFDRYKNGRKMAEGLSVNSDSWEAAAIRASLIALQEGSCALISTGIAELEADIKAMYASCREVEVILEEARKATEVPAAEYVPALIDAWDLIDKAIRKLP